MAKRKGLSFYSKKKKINVSILHEIFAWIFGICLSIFLAGVLVFFFGMTTNMVGDSMEPVLYNGQKVYIDRFRYILSTPSEGDVVVFLPKGNENSHYYVKRVVAVPGDHLIFQNGYLYVNGLQSPWVTEKVSDYGMVENEITLELGEFFCIGDNPNNSEDSRSANIGPVKEVEVIGKVWFRAGNGESGMGLVK